MMSARRVTRLCPPLVWILWILSAPSAALARHTGVQPPAEETPAPSAVEQALIEYRCRVARTEMSEACLSAQLLALRTDFGRDLSKLSAAERRTTDSACSRLLAGRGREAYVQCLSDQLVSLHNRRVRANPPPPPPSPETAAPPPSTTAPSSGVEPTPSRAPSRLYRSWIGAALVILAVAAAGGVFLAMRTRRAPRKCRGCGANLSESGDLCQQCRHDAAEALRRAAAERAEQQRAQEEARRRQGEQAEEERLQKARQEEASRLRLQEQARQAEEARRAEELRQREDEARQRSQVGGGTQGQLDPYAILGLPQDATREDIETAYQNAKVKYDPENAAFLPTELQELFKQKGLAAERAYKKLTE
jgi:hypothetical protein